MWIAAVELQAQPKKTQTMDIFIVGTACTLWDGFQIVVDGKESKAFRVRTADSRWVGEIPEPFDAEDAYASLRINGARTRCQPSRQARDASKKNAYLGKFVFTCPKEPGKVVSIATKPEKIPVSYVRNMPRDATIEDSRDCDEGSLFEGSGTITAVQFGTERLRLRIVPTKDSSDPGLLVDDKVLRAIERGDTLGRNDVLKILQRQRGGQKAGTGSQVSDTAYKIDKDRLDKAKFESLTLKVE